MTDPRKQFGNDAEAVAAHFLQEKGMRILATQFRTRLGEIDLIAEDGNEVVFVEVKARKTAEFGYPEESVTRRKLQKILMTGEAFLQQYGWEERAYRIDVVAIEFYLDPPRIHYLPAVG